MLGAISWHRLSHPYMHGTRPHSRATSVRPPLKQKRVPCDKGEALPTLKHWKRFGVTNETIGNRQLAFIVTHSVSSCFVWVRVCNRRSMSFLRWVA